MAKGGNKRDFGEHATEGGNKRNFGEHATKSGHKRGFGWKQPFLLPIGDLCVHSVCTLCALCVRMCALCVHDVCTMYARCAQHIVVVRAYSARS